jgi:peptide/nickel transport system substrate-binding protein
MLEGVGFEVAVNNDQTVGELLRLTDIDRTYETACSGFQIGEDSVWLTMASGFYCDSSSNRLGYCDERMDALLDELRVAANIDEEKEILGRIQEVWNETVPSSITETIEETFVVNASVGGIVPTVDSRVLFHDAYIQG